MNIYFSPSEIAFYDYDMKEAYDNAGTWPEDATPIDKSVWLEYIGSPPEGKTLGVIDGQPGWVDLPPPSQEEVVAYNTGKKADLMDKASEMISILTDATDEDIMGDDIDPNDLVLLKAWKAYRVKLLKVTDMLNPVWPNKPDA